MPLKIAALDLGSNSFHLALAEARVTDTFALTASWKEKVQLGRAVFQAGLIDESTFERGIGALQRLRAALDRERPDMAAAVATSALREASNGFAFAKQAELILGMPVRVISGEEEARLVASGSLQCLTSTRGRVAIFDLGGGSTEIILASPQGCALATSVRLGTLRLLSEPKDNSRPSQAWFEERARGVLEPTLARVRGLGFEAVVLSCGTARRLLGLASELGLGSSGDDILTREVLAQLLQRLAARAPDAPAAMKSDESGRVDTLFAGACVFNALFACLDVDNAIVSRAGLREGLIAEQLASYSNRSGCSLTIRA